MAGYVGRFMVERWEFIQCVCWYCIIMAVWSSFMIYILFFMWAKFFPLYKYARFVVYLNYSIFWDMRVIKEYQENLCSCCNREWKKSFDVEETCLVMCAVHIGIRRWNSIIIISVGANRRNLMTITTISPYFPTFAYVLTFLALLHFNRLAPYLYYMAIPWQLQPSVLQS
jgi:hypothetical protein